MTPEKEKYLIEGLTRIACLDDKSANHYLETTGSYAAFDEPGSVRIAREILADLAAIPPADRGGER